MTVEGPEDLPEPIDATEHDDSTAADWKAVVDAQDVKLKQIAKLRDSLYTSSHDTARANGTGWGLPLSISNSLTAILGDEHSIERGYKHPRPVSQRLDDFVHLLEQIGHQTTARMFRNHFGDLLS